MSATYLLEHISTVKDGGAIWCSEWATQTNGEGVVITAGADHTIKMWNPLKGGTPKMILKPSSLGIVGLAVDPSESGANFLCASSLDGVITRFSMEGVPEGRVEMKPAESWDLALNPKTLQLATAGMSATVRILSSAPENFGEELTTMDGSGTFGMAVEYSDDGRLLAVASDSGSVSLFDLSTGGTLVSSFQAHSAPIRSIQFTSNLLVTASDDKRINVFDLRALVGGGGNQTGGGSRRGEVASMGGHEGWVVSVAARNDRLLASGSSDGTIKLWDLSSPSTALSTLRDHGDVWSLAWKPDVGPPVIEGLGGSAAGIGGGQLLSAGEDGNLRWWRGGG